MMERITMEQRDADRQSGRREKSRVGLVRDGHGLGKSVEGRR
jgi:hypothetical protein